MVELWLFILFANLSLVSGLCSTCLKERCYDNGECIIGCESGYIGKYCDEACPSRCLKACHFHRTDGDVTCTDGCSAGFCGPKCFRSCPKGCVTCDSKCGSCNVTLCPEGHYGTDCTETCRRRYEKCDRETGSCIKCKQGYYGDECTQECRVCFNGTDNIRDTCLSGCEICKTQGTCPDGFYGNSCNKSCSNGCKKPGDCNRATGECSDGCVSGYHGITCNYTCDRFCVDGICNQDGGNCTSGCINGYRPYFNICETNSNKDDSGPDKTVAIAVPICVIAALVVVVVAVAVIWKKRSKGTKKRHPEDGSNPGVDHLLLNKDNSSGVNLSLQDRGNNSADNDPLQDTDNSSADNDSLQDTDNSSGVNLPLQDRGHNSADNDPLQDTGNSSGVNSPLLKPDSTRETVAMVLLGKTGVGKSETGNTIVGTTPFDVGASSTPVTLRCKQHTFVIDGQKLQLVDTPGFLGSNTREEEVKACVEECLRLSCKGRLHALLFLIAIERFTVNDRETINQFFEIFGEEAKDFVIVIITKFDLLKEENQELENFIGNAPKDLKDFLEKTDNRYIHVNNWSDDEAEKKTFINNLLSMVESLLKANGGRCYTKEMFQKAQRQSEVGNSEEES